MSFKLGIRVKLQCSKGGWCSGLSYTYEDTFVQCLLVTMYFTRRW
jgi:hypothetical protein